MTSKFEKQATKKEKNQMPEEVIPDNIPKLNNAKLASDIILAISHELHVRVGIGPIWRQLNAARKKEIIDTWTFKTIELLEKNR